MKKGQLFSLDFVIAMVITVLAIGMLLDFYEISSNQTKEINSQNELQIILGGVNNAITGTAKCEPIGDEGGINFAEQGYKLYGCINKTKLQSLGSSALMMPSGYECYITIEGTPISGCSSTDDSSGKQTVGTIKKQILTSNVGGEIGGRGIIDLMIVFDESGSMAWNGAFEEPLDIARRSQTSAAKGVYLEQGTAYLADGHFGLRKLNTSNPENLLDSNPPTYDPGVVYDVHGEEASGEIFVLAKTTDQNYVIRVTKDPLAVNDAFEPLGRISLGSVEVHKLFVKNNIVYALTTQAGRPTLRIINAPSTGSMSEAGSMTFTDPNMTPFDIFVENNFAYIAGGAAKLKIINVSNPGSMGVPITYGSPNFNVFSIFVQGNLAYVGSQQGLQFLDVTAPQIPVLLGTQPGSTRFVFVNGNTVYRLLQTSPRRIQKLDVTFSPFSVQPNPQIQTEITGIQDFYLDKWHAEEFMYFAVIAGENALVNLSLQNNSKMIQAKLAAHEFVNDAGWNTDEGDRMGLMSFNAQIRPQIPDPNPDQELTTNIQEVNNAIDALIPSGQTFMTPGIRIAKNELINNGNPDEDTLQFMVMLSDGKADDGPTAISEAQAARNAGITIYAVG
ncbi:MAG TPA: VWA domain-containing protein, partial [archaeon]|nr:VWA domain-containing protein [archaeon]